MIIMMRSAKWNETKWNYKSSINLFELHRLIVLLKVSVVLYWIDGSNKCAWRFIAGQNAENCVAHVCERKKKLESPQQLKSYVHATFVIWHTHLIIPFLQSRRVDFFFIAAAYALVVVVARLFVYINNIRDIIIKLYGTLLVELGRAIVINAHTLN